jgi:hypothetical protein
VIPPVARSPLPAKPAPRSRSPRKARPPSFSGYDARSFELIESHTVNPRWPHILEAGTEDPLLLKSSTPDPIDKLFSLLPAADTLSDSGSSLYSDHMLAELIALQEGMIARLRLERLSIVGTPDFLANMIDHFLTDVIDQHEKAAAMLRAQFETHGAGTLDLVHFRDRPSNPLSLLSLTERCSESANLKREWRSL